MLFQLVTSLTLLINLANCITFIGENLSLPYNALVPIIKFNFEASNLGTENGQLTSLDGINIQLGKLIVGNHQGNKSELLQNIRLLVSIQEVHDFFKKNHDEEISNACSLVPGSTSSPVPGYNSRVKIETVAQFSQFGQINSPLRPQTLNLPQYDKYSIANQEGNTLEGSFSSLNEVSGPLLITPSTPTYNIKLSSSSVYLAFLVNCNSNLAQPPQISYKAIVLNPMNPGVTHLDSGTSAIPKLSFGIALGGWGSLFVLWQYGWLWSFRGRPWLHQLISAILLSSIAYLLVESYYYDQVSSSDTPHHWLLAVRFCLIFLNSFLIQFFQIGFSKGWGITRFKWIKSEYKCVIALSSAFGISRAIFLIWGGTIWISTACLLITCFSYALFNCLFHIEVIKEGLSYIIPKSQHEPIVLTVPDWGTTFLAPPRIRVRDPTDPSMKKKPQVSLISKSYKKKYRLYKYLLIPLLVTGLLECVFFLIGNFVFNQLLSIQYVVGNVILLLKYTIICYLLRRPKFKTPVVTRPFNNRWEIRPCTRLRKTITHVQPVNTIWAKLLLMDPNPNSLPSNRWGMLLFWFRR